MPAVASPARRRRWEGWPCSSPAVEEEVERLLLVIPPWRRTQTMTAWRITAIAEIGVPVPKPYLICVNGKVIKIVLKINVYSSEFFYFTNCV